MICSLMLGKMELPINCISAPVSWSTYTCEHQMKHQIKKKMEFIIIIIIIHEESTPV